MPNYSLKETDETGIWNVFRFKISVLFGPEEASARLVGLTVQSYAWVECLSPRESTDPEKY